MSSNDQFDELFRRALPSVDVPPAPEMDWNAMAGLAKGGAAAGASTSIWTAAWVKVLGGAVAVLVGGAVVWNVARTEEEPSTAEQLVRTEQVERQTSVLVDEAGTSTAQEIATSASYGGVERDAQAADVNAPAAPVVARVKGSKVRSTPPASPTRKAQQRAVQVAGIAAIDQRASSSVNDEHAASSEEVDVAVSIDPGFSSDDSGSGSAHRTPAISTSTKAKEGIAEHVLVDDPAVVGNEERSDADPGTALAGTNSPFSDRFLLERATSIELLRHGPPLVPLAPSTTAETIGPAFARFSLSPWVSVNNSIFRDPDGTSNEDNLAQLSGGREMIGTVGVRAQYNLDQRLAVLLGVQYTNKGSLQGRLVGANGSYTHYDWSGRSIEVPIALRYAFPLEGKEFYVRLGGTLQFNARGGSDRVVQFNGSRKELSTLVLSSRSMGAAIDLGVGVQFRIARGIGLFIEPSYQYGLDPVVKHPSFKTLPYNPMVHSIGLGTGLVFQFPHR